MVNILKFIELNKNNIIKKLKEGIESITYVYKEESNYYCLKLFKKQINFSDHQINVSKEVLENKRKKIEIINEDPIFFDEVRPIALVYENGEFVGYIMELDYSKSASFFDKRKKKVEILKKYKEKIEKFNKKGIYVGDISENNILVFNNGIKLCDLDNIKIGDLGFDIQNYFQKRYFETYGNIEYIDRYTFNLFTISYLSKIIPSYIDNYLIEGKLPKPINSERNFQLIKQRNYIEDYFIDNLREYK